MIYSFLALGGVGVVILLGRIYLKGPEERPVTRIPLPPPAEGEKTALRSREVKPAPAAKEDPKPAAESKGPPSAGRPSAPVPEPKQEIRVTESAPASTGSQAAGGKTRAEMPVERTVVTKPGDSLYTIAARTYKIANTSIVDQILEFNPQVAGPNKVLANQKIRLPEITEESLIIGSPGGTCKIRLGTFLKPEYSAFLKGQPSLMGKKVEITPRRLSSGETWYRAVAGPFSSREEALRAIHALKAKGLSPYFAGFKNK
jgi:phage tail protein X